MNKLVLPHLLLLLISATAFATSYQDITEHVPEQITPATWEVYGAKEAVVLESDGILSLNPEGAPKVSGLISRESLDESSFQIDAWIDPAVGAPGDDNLFVGISLGMANPSGDPSHLGNTAQKVSLHLHERVTEDRKSGGWVERLGRWMLTVDDEKVSDRFVGEGDSFPDEMPFGTYAFRLREGPYQIRLVGTPQDGGTFLRVYVMDMMRPAEEHFVKRAITPGRVAIYAARTRENKATQAQIYGFKMQAITPEQAMRNYSSEEYVLRQLDLEHPKMRPVSQAIRGGDWERAASRFIRHMRDRSEPQGPELDPQYYKGNFLEIADKACKGTYGFRTWFGGGGQWHDLFMGPDDPRVKWELDSGYLNRFFHWVSLAKAYQETEADKYAERFAFEVKDWVGREPFYRKDNPDTGNFDLMDGTRLSRGWMNTSNIGRRTEMTWWPAFEVFRQSDTVADEAIFAFLDGVIRQANLITNPSVFAPWDDGGMHATIGLLNTSVYFPECALSDFWKDIAEERLTVVLDTQVYPDGAHASLSTGYGFALNESFKNYFETCKRTGTRPPQAVVDKFERLLHWPMAMCRPNQRLIPLNDGTYDPFSKFYRDALEFFPEREDFRWFATKGKEGRQPDFTSTYLPHAGWLTMRTGWGPEEKWMFMDAGPLGASHCKEDKLSIWMDYGGHVILGSGGRASYSATAAEFGPYANSSFSKNVVVVNGNRQFRLRSGMNAVLIEEERRRWHSDEHYDYGEGFYELASDGGGQWGQWTRQILHIKGTRSPDSSYFVVFDTIYPTTDGEQEYTALFHSGREEAAVVDPDNQIVELWDEDASGRIIPIGPDDLSARIVRGQKEPHIQGWRVEYSGEVEEQNCIEYSWKASGVTTRAWVLIPASADKDWNVKDVELIKSDAGEITAKINRVDGGYDWVHRRSSGMENASGYNLQGDFAVASMDEFGRRKAAYQTNPMAKAETFMDPTSQSAFPVAANDLLNNGSGVLKEMRSPSFESVGPQFGELDILFDGKLGGATEHAAACLHGSKKPYHIILDLDTSEQREGYDISEIWTTTAWSEGWRIAQSVVLEYSTVDAPDEFVIFGRGTVYPEPSIKHSSSQIRFKHPSVEGGFIAENVSSLRLSFMGMGGGVGPLGALREIDVFTDKPDVSTASFQAEPSVATLAPSAPAKVESMPELGQSRILFEDSFDGNEGTGDIVYTSAMIGSQSGLVSPSAWQVYLAKPAGLWAASRLINDDGHQALMLQVARKPGEKDGWTQMMSGFSLAGHSPNWQMDYRIKQKGSHNTDFAVTIGHADNKNFFDYNQLAKGILQIRTRFVGSKCSVMMHDGSTDAWTVNTGYINLASKGLEDKEQWIDCRIVGYLNEDQTTKILLFVADLEEPIAQIEWSSNLSKLENGYLGLSARGGQTNVASSYNLDFFRITEYER